MNTELDLMTPHFPEDLEPEHAMLAPVGEYLKSLPILAEVLLERMGPRIGRSTTDADLRELRRQTTADFVAERKAAHEAYAVLHFPKEELPCKVEGCNELIKGVYLEIVNPVTRASHMLPMLVGHMVMTHHEGHAKEALRNLGNSPYGDADIQLDAAALKKTLNQLTLPEGVLEALETFADAFPVYKPIPVPFTPVEPSAEEQELGIVPFFNVLAHLVEYGCADIHIKAGHPPCGVLRGQVTPFTDFPVLTPEVTYRYVCQLLSEAQKKVFDEIHEMDVAFPVKGIGRFRCNIYQAAGAAGMVLRVIASEILPAEVLGLPPVLKKTVFERQGLILITGQTGSGKTTTLAALLEFANRNRKIHVLTLENPVEFVYEPKQAIFTQREMEVDSTSFTLAMRGALRQKPDIILIGEMRDSETITSGLKAAETGHLVMSTLHTNDAVQTINRLINTFPPHEQEAVRVQLANSIKASVAQRLIPRADKPGRVASLEILMVMPNARGENTKQFILKGDSDALYRILKTSEYDGMQSQNQSLFKHYTHGLISADDALANSDNPDELNRFIREYFGLGGGR